METSKKQFSRDVLDGMAICDPRKKRKIEKVTKKHSNIKKMSQPFFRGTYWTEWPFANYAFTNLTMKCSQTNTPAHKNEADQLQSQKLFL